MIWVVQLAKSYKSTRFLKNICVSGSQPVKNWLNVFYKDWLIISLKEVSR